MWQAGQGSTGGVHALDLNKQERVSHASGRTGADFASEQLLMFTYGSGYLALSTSKVWFHFFFPPSNNLELPKALSILQPSINIRVSKDPSGDYILFDNQLLLPFNNILKGFFLLLIRYFPPQDCRVS